MKKILVGLMVCVMALVGFGCGGKKGATDASGKRVGLQSERDKIDAAREAQESGSGQNTQK